MEHLPNPVDIFHHLATLEGSSANLLFIIFKRTKPVFIANLAGVKSVQSRKWEDT